MSDIDVVIIGVNAVATLKDCIESVLMTNYPPNLMHIYYVDGGSNDGSIDVAKSYPEVNVIELNDSNPTPGKGRNAGWKKGSSSYVQFLDSDTLLEKNWLEKALVALQDQKIAAVCGNRQERNPDKSVYNWIADQEWNGPPGCVQAFGGDVMLSRKALDESRGYNEDLVGGEDPELSLRLCKKGNCIIHLDVPMTLHDIGMKSWLQYWKRAYRTGYAYAAVKALHSTKSGFWQVECKRILIRGGCAIVLFIAAILWNSWCLLPGLLLLFYPLLNIQKFESQKNMTQRQAITYSIHCSVVVIPQCFGILRYYLGRMFSMPLKNNSLKIQTHSSTIE
jgi:glycosyltransferase involved in cell wall biosynthesis